WRMSSWCRIRLGGPKLGGGAPSRGGPAKCWRSRVRPVVRLASSPIWPLPRCRRCPPICESQRRAHNAAPKWQWRPSSRRASGWRAGRTRSRRATPGRHAVACSRVPYRGCEREADLALVYAHAAVSLREFPAAARVLGRHVDDGAFVRRRPEALRVLAGAHQGAGDHETAVELLKRFRAQTLRKDLL